MTKPLSKTRNSHKRNTTIHIVFMIMKSTIQNIQAFRIMSLVVLTGWFCGLPAQIPAPPQSHPVAITEGTIHTITDGVIENGTLVFEDGIIVSVGQGVEIPAGAEVIDATGKHVYPGFIHGRTGIGLMEISRIRESTDLRETGQINPNIRAQVAFHPASEHLPVAAVHGVTTVVPTPGGSLISGQLSAMMTDGWTWEQMTLREGIGMAVEWPSMNDMDAYRASMDILQEAFDKARRYKTARKAMEEGNSEWHPADIRWEAMIPVLAGEMPVFISVGEIRQIQAAISWAESENLKPVLVGNRDIDLVADQLAHKNIPVMLAGVISGPIRQWQQYGEGYRTAKILYRAGVSFCIAGDAGPASAYRIHHHAASAVAFGLPEEYALKAITINAAKILGIDDLTGSIEPGKHATLMITNGNPLELWTKKEQVFIKGRKIDMVDKHLRLFERYMEKFRQEL
ncbi:MAG: hypothetical protein EA394_08270 [Bacteroidia bacterium]|nr:MAG: hypothetical protein EA394_08270 [Bacteroidia bacterium]